MVTCSPIYVVRKHLVACAEDAAGAQSLEPRAKTAVLCRVVEALKGLWQNVRGLLQQRNTRHALDRSAQSELLVLVAEAATAVACWDIANDACRTYFRFEQSRTDNFACRALLAKAQLEGAKSQGLTGASLTQQARHAASYATEALRLAKAAGKRYDFCARNACVILWSILFPILVPGRAKYARDALIAGCDALEGDSLCLYSRATAAAFDDAGDSVEAIKYFRYAIDSASNKHEATMQASSLVRFGGQALNFAESIAPTQPRRTVELHALRRLRSTPGDILDRIRAIAEPTDDIDVIADAGRLCLRIGSEAAKAFAKTCLARALDAKHVTAVTRVKIDFLRCWLISIELDGDDCIPEWAATSPGLDGLSTQFSESRIRCHGPKATAKQLRAARLSRRIEALKLLERALMASARLCEPELTQEGCALVWNIGLALTQPHVRKHTHRAFRVAAQLLEELKSPLVEVRARLHMELAHCELAADFISKARDQLAAASRIDYGTVDAAEAERDIGRDADLHDLTADSPPQHAAALDVEKRYALRPLDRYADPLNRRLELRASGADPETAEDKATLVLDHALEVPSAQLQWKMLDQVASILIEAEADSQPLANATELATAALNEDADTASWGSASAGAACAALDISPWPTPTIGAQRGRLEQGVRLWTSLIELAWHQHRNTARQLVQAGAGIALRCGWPEATHSELCACQVICQYALAETFIDELYLAAEKALKEARRHATSDEKEEASRTKAQSSDDTSRRQAIAFALAETPSEWIEMGIDCAAAYAKRSAEPELSANAQPACDFVVPEGPNQLTALKRLCAATFAAGIERARRLANAKLVRNGCVLLWNHHSHICRGDNKYAVCIPELANIFDRALEAAVETDVKDEWLCAGLSQIIAGIHASRGDQGRAIEVCATAALQYGVARPLAVKGVVEMHAKLTLGDKPLAPSEKGKKASEESSFFRAMRLLEKMRLAPNGSEIEILVREATEAIELETQHQHQSAKEKIGRAREFLSSGNAASDVDAARAFMLPSCREADVERLELRMELWARVSSASLKIPKGSSWTAYCASKCLEELGDDRQPDSPYDEDGCYELAEQHLTTLLQRPGASDDDNAQTASILPFWGEVPLTAWRWAAVAETARARAIEQSVDAASQRKEQDMVLVRAFAHYSRAMRFGVTAKRWPELTYQAGNHLWVAAVPLTQSRAARRLVKAPIKCALACLYASGEASSWAGAEEVIVLISNFLETLLDCEADDANWSRGLKIIDDAMPRLGPIANAIQHEVADPRNQTLDARSQKDAPEDGDETLESMKIDANGVRRRLLNKRVTFLSKLGRSQAATQLKSDGEAKEVARVWATFARSSADPRQQMAAYRKVLEVTTSMFDRVEYLVEVAEWMLQRGATRREARSALCLAMDYCLEVESRVDNAETADTRSVSGLSSAEDDISQRSERRNHLSTNSLKSVSQRSIVSHAPKFLSAEHLELLVRTLSMLAQLSTNLGERRYYLLLGHHYSCVCIRRHVAAVNAAIELRLDSTATEDNDEEKIRPYAEPTSISSWCKFMIDQKFVEWTRSTPRSHRRNVFSAETLRRLPLAAHHLTYLIDALIDCGFHAHALAPLSLLQLLGMLASSSPSNRPPPLAVLAGTRRTRLLYALGATSAAQLQFEELGKLGPLDEDAFEATDVERLLEAPKEMQTTKETDWKVSQLATRWVWVGIAAEMVGLEELEIGEAYLSAARRHNIAFQDYACAARSTEIAAWIAARRGALAEAKRLFRAAQSRATHDIKAWVRLALSLARISLAVDERCQARAQLETALEKMPCVDDFDIVLARCQINVLLARLDASKGKVDTATERLESVIEQLDLDRDEPPHPLELDARASLSHLLIADEGIIECTETVLHRARSLWAAAWPATTDTDSQVSLPVARRVGTLCLNLCRLRLAATRRHGQSHDHDANGGDAAKNWLEKTAPLRVDSSKFEPLDFEKAAFHAASAAGVARITPCALPAVAAASGETAVVAAAHYGKLDSVWDDSAEAEEQVAACLNTSAPNDSAPPIVSDAVECLSVAISTGLRVGRFEEVGAAALWLAEMCGGGMKPKTTSRALLLHQSCVARRWLARFMRTIFAFDAHCPDAMSAHVMARCGSHYGLGVDDCGFAWRSCDDDILEKEDGAACVHAPLTTTPNGLCGGLLRAAMSSSLPVAHPAECPAVHRESAKLAERSVAWSMLDLGSMPTIDEIIAALPDLFVISLQLSSDALYATVVRTSSGEAAVAKHAMQPGDWNIMSTIDTAISQWRRPPRQQATLEADEFSALMQRASSFFAPVLEANARVAAALAAISEAKEIVTGKSKQTTNSRPMVCILADIRFQRWPLEALEQFRRLDARLSRDFSIHTLYARLGAQVETFSYLADPHSTSEHLESLRRFTTGWTGISGREVDRNECTKLLSECRNGAFVYYGPGRAPTRIPAKMLASMDLRKSIRVAVLIDRDDNAAARRYRLKADASKKPAELALEDPLETAAAWTLAGVGAVVINQWRSTFEANQIVLQQILSGLKEKLPLVEAVHTVRQAPPADADGGHLSAASERLNPVLFGLPTLSKK